MSNRIVFREMLSEIKALADEKGNRLTQSEIKEFFANAHLTEEQFLLIYDYLENQKIKVEGYTSKKKEEEAEKREEAAAESFENHFLEMYLEDMEEILPITEEEELRLFEETAGGSREAKNKLAEQYLKIVYELSVTYVGSNLPQEDLIQEGNVGLLLALDCLEPQKELEEYRRILFSAMQEAMEQAIEQSQDTRDMDEEIAGRVNHLNEAILNLEKDLGHKVSIAELSAYLEMPLEEIKAVLRMAGDEMKEK